jgi:hypothetical protein
MWWFVRCWRGGTSLRQGRGNIVTKLLRENETLRLIPILEFAMDTSLCAVVARRSSIERDKDLDQETARAEARSRNINEGSGRTRRARRENEPQLQAATVSAILWNVELPTS